MGESLSKSASVYPRRASSLLKKLTIRSTFVVGKTVTSRLNPLFSDSGRLLRRWCRATPRLARALSV